MSIVGKNMSIVGKRVSFNYWYVSEKGDSCKSISGTVVDKYISNGNTMYLIQFISDSDLHGDAAFHVEPKDISNVII